MSIIIKGINLPKEVGNVISITLYDKKDNWLDNIEVYRKDIIEIPTPHGRLVDWDAFNSKLDIQYAEGRGKALAPTILEEEK